MVGIDDSSLDCGLSIDRPLSSSTCLYVFCFTKKWMADIYGLRNIKITRI